MKKTKAEIQSAVAALQRYEVITRWLAGEKIGDESRKTADSGFNIFDDRATFKGPHGLTVLELGWDKSGWVVSHRSRAASTANFDEAIEWFVHYAWHFAVRGVI